MFRRIARWFLLRATIVVLALSVALVLPLRFVPAPTSSFMLMHQARVAGARIEFQWVPRSEISQHAARAVLAAEDPDFFHHRGFDFAGIRDALAESLPDSPTRGASTISQQLAKNLYLWPDRSWVRKGIEAWMTLWLELFLPKERILETYLNVAQFGPAIYGIEAASRTYFSKPAAALTAEESALLAAVLPGPVRYRVGNPSPFVRERQAWVSDRAQVLAAGLDVSAFGPGPEIGANGNGLPGDAHRVNGGAAVAR